MAVPSPPSLAVGHILTAAELQQISDMALFGMNPPAASATRAAAQSIPNNTNTDVTWDTEHFDNDGLFTASSTTLTISEAGQYDIDAYITFAANATGIRSVSLKINGTKVREDIRLSTGAGSNTTCQLRVPCQSLVAGNTIVVQAYQNSGGALNLDNTAGLIASVNVMRVSGTPTA